MIRGVIIDCGIVQRGDDDCHVDRGMVIIGPELLIGGFGFAN